MYIVYANTENDFPTDDMLFISNDKIVYVLFRKDKNIYSIS